MTLNTAATEDDITAKVRDLFASTPRVWVTEVPDNVTTPAYPYAILYFGSPTRTATGRHITTTRWDLLRGFVTVQWVSTDDTSARAMDNKTRVSLTGYRPVDSGEMVLEGGMSYSRASTAVKPTLYYRETGFSYVTNVTPDA